MLGIAIGTSRQYTRRLLAFCSNHSANCGCFKAEIQYPKEKLKRVPLGPAWANVCTGYHGDPGAKSTLTTAVLAASLVGLPCIGITVEPLYKDTPEISLNPDTMHVPSYIKKCIKLPLK